MLLFAVRKSVQESLGFSPFELVFGHTVRGPLKLLMKLRFDKRARQRQFKPGDKVLVLLPVPENPLQAKFFGPYTSEKKLIGLNYIVHTHGW